MGWWQARAPVEGAVKLSSTEPTIRLSQQNTKLAADTKVESRTSNDANTANDNRPKPYVEIPTSKVQTNKAVPEPIEKSNSKSNEFKTNAITSVVPASYHEHEDAKGSTESKAVFEQKQSQPQTENHK